METLVPDWLNFLAAISSIVGVLLSILVYREAKEIRRSFLRKARLPELIADLGKTSKTLSKCLIDWPNEKRAGIKEIHVAVGLLENVEKKIPDEQRKRIRTAIAKLSKRRLFKKEAVTDATEDQAWDYYNELSAAITALEQLVKDTKWD